MERTINITVDAMGGITPKTPQYAGVQGEHNACRVVFDVSAWSGEPFVYRGEFVSGDGTGGTMDTLEAADGCVSFPLPATWTAAGGRAVARLVASVMVDGEETQTVYAVDVPLYFAAKQEYSAAVAAEEYAGLTALVTSVQAAVDKVERRLADGSLIGPQGEKGEQGVSGVYVGSGDMPEGYNIQIDPNGNAFIGFEVGEVVTLPEGEEATATVTGTPDAPILNLGIPRGATGLQGLQGEPGKDAVLNELTLIASGTTTEAVNRIVISQDNDGNNFTLRDFVWVVVEVPVAAQDTRLSVWFGDTLQQVNAGVSTTAARINKLVGFYTGRGWDFLFTNTAITNEYSALQTRTKDFWPKSNGIAKVEIGCYTTSHVLPVGTKYQIYGRRV